MTDVIDAAIIGIQEYLAALDQPEDQVNIELRPSFNVDGVTTRIAYTVEVWDGDITTESAYDGLKDLPDLQYESWLEAFTRAFPRTHLEYRPASPEPIENALETVRRAEQAFRVKEGDISIMVEPVYDPERDRWTVEHNVRTPSPNQAVDFAQDVAGYDTDRVRKDIYPLWIHRFSEEFGEESLFYPDPDDVDWRD